MCVYFGVYFGVCLYHMLSKVPHHCIPASTELMCDPSPVTSIHFLYSEMLIFKTRIQEFSNGFTRHLDLLLCAGFDSNIRHSLLNGEAFGSYTSFERGEIEACTGSRQENYRQVGSPSTDYP